MQSNLPKQYLPLNGRPLLAGTLERLCAQSRVHGVMVGIAPDDSHWAALTSVWSSFPKLRGTFLGGATRAATVLNGLRALAAAASDADWVMVHDAVRPCLRAVDVDRLIAAVEGTEDGGLLALPVADTVKRADADNCVTETVSRVGLWRALTPQIFRVGGLRTALENAQENGIDVTDEAMAIERMGGRPKLVHGHPDNIKITHPSDLALAELFLRQQAGAA